MPSVEPPTLATHLLTALLPPELADSIQKHILHPRSPVQIIARNVLDQAQSLLDTAAPLLEPLFDRVMILLAENQGLVGVIASLVVLATVVIILNWIRRLLMWWTRVAMRIATWAFLLALAAWIWERGVFESARDMAVMGGKIVGYLAVIKDVWLQEYDRYEAQQGMAGTRGTASGRRSR
ncbi:nuclear pore assembly and biogenesis domain containing protein [Fusarium agapanthi]|uniref:Nuclear pore assembly and biogenesis domain containing protein n=1 Tax=Fusarium agapanthi TaxID=1803897 RepID=A0A9P5EDE8_9HYPO|nr:nuclear pore assembly and biogenesis domain containing protein [Fusarium agapanthi]